MFWACFLPRGKRSSTSVRTSQSKRRDQSLSDFSNQSASKEMLHKLVDLITSLKLTIACLAAAMVLVLAGTFAQVHFGIHLVQQRYFQSLFVWWAPHGHSFKCP